MPVKVTSYPPTLRDYAFNLTTTITLDMAPAKPHLSNDYIKHCFARALMYFSGLKEPDVAAEGEGILVLHSLAKAEGPNLDRAVRQYGPELRTILQALEDSGNPLPS
jgi:hypothetical protein